MIAPSTPRVALLAAHVDDVDLAPVLARALAVPVLTCPVLTLSPRAARWATDGAPRYAHADVLVHAALRRATTVLHALRNATLVLAVAEVATPDAVVPGRWCTRQLVLQLERDASGGPPRALAGEARASGPLARCIDATSRERLVARAAATLARHAARPCPTCGHAGFGALARCLGCGAGRPQVRKSDRRAVSWMARTAGWVSFRSTEIA